MIGALDNWDRRFLALAGMVAGWSKDPSTKVGAAIVGERRRVLSLGYNGFPRGIDDREERLLDRDVKLSLIAHAERNALDNAECSVRGATLYATLCPCAECCKSIIQRGISRVVWLPPTPAQAERWASSFQASMMMLIEANIELAEADHAF
ncbi:deaminase (plasmid) [Azospirillum sp. HJ39]|uniref:deoxycytidylate deaminase n=1 Tax=Azospirillum sp. HJ39 TaxID=3159496 RepID=UPI0035570610